METKFLTIHRLTENAYSKMFRFAYVNKIPGEQNDETNTISLVIGEEGIRKFQGDTQGNLYIDGELVLHKGECASFMVEF